jgi:hypothetical protein
MFLGERFTEMIIALTKTVKPGLTHRKQRFAELNLGGR